MKRESEGESDPYNDPFEDQVNGPYNPYNDSDSDLFPSASPGSSKPDAEDTTSTSYNERTDSDIIFLKSEDEDEDVKDEVRMVKKPKLEKGKFVVQDAEEEVQEVDAPLTQVQLQRIKELKEFYSSSQEPTAASEGSGDDVGDAAGSTSCRTFVQDFQVAWYLNEAVSFFPDVSSVPEDSFIIPRDRNLWFLYKAPSGSWTNERPVPNFAIGSQVECVYPGTTRVLRVLAKHLCPSHGDKWKFGPNTSYRNHHQQHYVVDHGFSYQNRENVEYSMQTLTVPASLSVSEAVEHFLESEEHDYIKRLPSGYRSKSARRALILESLFDSVDYKGTASANTVVAVKQPRDFRNFPLSAIKVFFRRTKDCHEFRFYFDTTKLKSCLKDVALFKILGTFYKGNLSTQLQNPELGNTLEFVPRTPKEGFGLHLYDYQKRSLQWMYQVEKKENSVSIIKRGDTAHLARFDSMPDVIVNFSESTLIDRPTPYYEQTDFTCLGGVLADNPGYGKTITTLALIHSNPLDSFNALPLTPVEKFYLFPSRATLIICPANLVKQWQAEVEKCLPKSTRCYTVSWILEHRKLSWSDVIQADIVIISVAFLSNQNYHKFLKEHFNKPSDVYGHGPSSSEPYFAPAMRKIIPARKEVCDTPGSVNFEAIYWHRIVFDEFHELEKAEKNSRGMAKAFKGLYHWGMTGTPAFKTTHDINVSAEFLSVTLDSSESSSLGRCLSFKSNFIRRNNEDLELPPLIDEIEWVKLTQPEMALYNVRSVDSEIEKFMACSHYQISDEVVNATGDEILSIDKVSELLCQRLVATCKQLEGDIHETKAVIAQVEREIRRNQFELPADKAKAKRELDREVENLKMTQGQYASKTRELAYFQGVMLALENDSLDESCLICLDDLKMENQQLCVTKCGHVFCVPCVVDYLAAPYPNPKVCPKCRELMKREDIMRVDPKAHAEKVKTEKAEKAVDKEQLAKCGSKISAMIKRMKKIKQENPNAKVILFCQFRRLANIIYSTLTDNGVSVVRVHGSHATRNNAVNEFKSNPDCSVIMLSTEDSVSGLHLPEATHIFISHPFWFGSSREQTEKAISAEKQGIARAHRLGLQHELKVIRFYTKDTIEETVSKDRSAL